MKKNKWDNYFYSHYNPKNDNWGVEDVKKYRDWYYSWIEYIVSLPIIKKHYKKYAQAFEIGSGIGGTTSLFAERKFAITGSDISRDIVKAANTSHENIDFVFCDIEKGIKINKKYDFIFGFEVLEHLVHVEKSINQIRKSLKKKGIFIGSTPYPFPKAYSDPTHCNVNYPDEWKKMFGDAGFTYVETRPMSFLPFLWRINKYLNPVLPLYISFDNFVSTTLIIAQK